MTDPNDKQQQQANPETAQPGVQGEQGFKPITSETELSAWKDGVRKSIAADVRKQLQDDQDKRDADAKAEADRKEAEGRGAFEEVKQSLISERDTAAAERDTLKGERNSLAEYFDGQFKAALKDLPEAIVAFAPAEDASFADKKAWLVTAQAQAEKLGGNPIPGNGPNPKPGDGKRDLDAAAQQARASGKYTV